MSNHHNHPSHTYEFMNKHTALGILILIIGCYMAGYFVGSMHASHKVYKYSAEMRAEYPDVEDIQAYTTVQE